MFRVLGQDTDHRLIERVGLFNGLSQLRLRIGPQADKARSPLRLGPHMLGVILEQWFDLTEVRYTPVRGKVLEPSDPNRFTLVVQNSNDRFFVSFRRFMKRKSDARCKGDRCFAHRSVGVLCRKITQPDAGG